MNKDPRLSGRTDHPRLFFALWPDEQTRLFLTNTASRLVVPGTARCVARANLHLTLIFLGPVETSMQACCELAADTVRADKFLIVVNRLGCRFQRGIAWAGPSQKPPGLVSLVEKLNASLGTCGYEPETRRFSAHVTLARNARRCRSGVTIEPFHWDVDRFCLVSSNPRMADRRYQILRKWILK